MQIYNVDAMHSMFGAAQASGPIFLSHSIAPVEILEAQDVEDPNAGLLIDAVPEILKYANDIFSSIDAPPTHDFKKKIHIVPGRVIEFKLRIRNGLQNTTQFHPLFNFYDLFRFVEVFFPNRITTNLEAVLADQANIAQFYFRMNDFNPKAESYKNVLNPTVDRSKPHWDEDGVLPPSEEFKSTGNDLIDASLMSM